MNKPAAPEVADLTDPEQRLVAAARAGQLRDFVGGGPNDADEVDGWGPERTVRAGVLRDLLLGRHGELDPRGVQLRGARIGGVLDLDDVRTATPLRLTDCHAAVIRLRRAHLPALDLIGVRTTEINAENLRVDHDLNLTQLRAAGTGEDGVVRLVGAHIGGTLDCADADLSSSDGPALHADRLQVAGEVFLAGGFRAAGAGELGVVRLLGAHIGGQLICGGAVLSSSDGPALHADGLQVDDGMFLIGGFRAAGAGELGVVRLLGAHIGGTLDCTSAELSSSDGPALHADGLQVGGDVFLTGGFRAAGAGAGVVRLSGAHIGGTMECDGAVLTSSDGPALTADGLQVGGGVFLRAGFRAAGADPRGVIRLIGAHIGGTLDCNSAMLSGSDGPALHADRLQVDGGVFLTGGFRATGAGPDGVIRLPGAHIGSQFVGRGGQANHRGGGLDLVLYECRVGELLLDPGFAERLGARGLRYGGIPDGPTVANWLAWFRDPGLGYDAQPYQQLAAAHRAAGHENEARRILIAQQHDLAERGGLTGWLRFRHRLLGITLGYGYQSWRALAGLAATLAVAVTLAVAAGAQGIAVHTKDTASPGAHCALVEQVGLGVDLGTPLINTGAKTRCAIATDHNTTGGVLTAAGWLLQVFGFGFATLFVAGFTGVIRKG